MESKKSVLFLSPLKPYSGNQTTIDRIRQYLEPLYNCHTEDPVNLCPQKTFSEFLKVKQISAILAVHAYHSGIILLDCTVPYILVFGGTDINEFSKDESKFQIMTRAVQHAKFAVAFNDSVVNKAKSLWPDVCPKKLIVIPQGVSTTPSSCFNVNQFLQENYNISCGDSPLRLFTLIAGIRPVKDVTFLLKDFSAWHLDDHSDCFFLIIGPITDKSYHMQVESIIDSCKGVLQILALEKPDCHAIIRDSFALVNSSLSEGMSAALLEAMVMGVPVVARNIPGNAAVIQHRKTGFLFNTPQEFIEIAQELLQDRTLCTAIATSAKTEAERKYSCKKEMEAYRKLLNSM
ncbi:glycosyltransferase 1 domain-containing protein 1 [Lingula anatina]|uniref:Glycosyltransferase 1 domain-containing protein 1 n=1 Tax=Lingula anatina TaxID=7574 RepID=A0A1S3H7X6_LINAN|nr:glycosyltransferase 1 domain-containing protein 1 [Lingula anatina]|eukprot:XP_013381591.1 glycosyltransferase 1 domain-containing protein 1 [Lingula anatina]